jgi:hypothetical protein
MPEQKNSRDGSLCRVMIRHEVHAPNRALSDEEMKELHDAAAIDTLK